MGGVAHLARRRRRPASRGSAGLAARRGRPRARWRGVAAAARGERRLAADGACAGAAIRCPRRRVLQRASAAAVRVAVDSLHRLHCKGEARRRRAYVAVSRFSFCGRRAKCRRPPQPPRVGSAELRRRPPPPTARGLAAGRRAPPRCAPGTHGGAAGGGAWRQGRVATAPRGARRQRRRGDGRRRWRAGFGGGVRHVAIVWRRWAAYALVEGSPPPPPSCSGRKRRRALTARCGGASASPRRMSSTARGGRCASSARWRLRRECGAAGAVARAAAAAHAGGGARPVGRRSLSACVSIASVRSCRPRRPPRCAASSGLARARSGRWVEGVGAASLGEAKQWRRPSGDGWRRATRVSSAARRCGWSTGPWRGRARRGERWWRRRAPPPPRALPAGATIGGCRRAARSLARRDFRRWRRSRRRRRWRGGGSASAGGSGVLCAWRRVAAALGARAAARWRADALMGG